MPERTVTIINKLGLHARAAAKLVEVASGFDCHVKISNGQRQVNAKSIMGVMMLAASKGSNVILETSGQGAEDALVALENLINDRFGEAQ